MINYDQSFFSLQLFYEYFIIKPALLMQYLCVNKKSIIEATLKHLQNVSTPINLLSQHRLTSVQTFLLFLNFLDGHGSSICKGIVNLNQSLVFIYTCATD